MDVKTELATAIVAGFHAEKAAQKAAAEFQRVFRERQAPEEAPARRVARSGKQRLTKLLVGWGLAPSNSEAQRLIAQGGVEIDGTRVDDVKKEVDLSKPGEFLLRAGKKKFLRVVVE
jgi:tyrosyl-tRNA synthetase